MTIQVIKQNRKLYEKTHHKRSYHFCSWTTCSTNHSSAGHGLPVQPRPGDRQRNRRGKQFMVGSVVSNGNQCRRIFSQLHSIGDGKRFWQPQRLHSLVLCSQCQLKSRKHAWHFERFFRPSDQWDYTYTDDSNITLSPHSFYY